MSETSIIIGEGINVPPNIHLTINCSHLISNILMPFNITWTVNGFAATNGTPTKVVISKDGHQLIITSTLLPTGGELGNAGIYACRVCSNNGTCIKKQSHCEVCGKLIAIHLSNTDMYMYAFIFYM